MATYRGVQNGRAPLASTSQSGNAWVDSNKVTPSAALAIADVVVLMEIPAGIHLHALRYLGGDFDTGTTLVYDIGYRTKLPGGSATSLAYFADDATTLRAAVATWTDFVFEPVKFDEPVEIVLIPSVAATGVSGTPAISVQAIGSIHGIT